MCRIFIDRKVFFQYNTQVYASVAQQDRAAAS